MPCWAHQGGLKEGWRLHCFSPVPRWSLQAEAWVVAGYPQSSLAK